MSNKNKKKIKSSEIKITNADSLEQAARERRLNNVKNMLLWVGILSTIAYVILIYLFFTKGRGRINYNLASSLMLASSIVGIVGASAFVVFTRLNKTMKMLSVGIGLLGIYAGSLYVTYRLLMHDVLSNTNSFGMGSVFSILTVASLIIGLILMIIVAIRCRIAKG